MNAPQPVTRGDWQRALEENLASFNADGIEASELIAAVIANLKDRYDSLDDVEHEYGQLKEALEALHETPTEADRYYEMADRRYDEWAQAQIDEETHG